uniref:Uncharacterized protein n=1 Tax=Cucumis melo TaxID=3656 RepID=A0A9I9DRE8_CUCME
MDSVKRPGKASTGKIGGVVHGSGFSFEPLGDEPGSLFVGGVVGRVDDDRMGKVIEIKAREVTENLFGEKKYEDQKQRDELSDLYVPLEGEDRKKSCYEDNLGYAIAYAQEKVMEINRTHN